MWYPLECCRWDVACGAAVLLLQGKLSLCLWADTSKLCLFCLSFEPEMSPAALCLSAECVTWDAGLHFDSQGFLQAGVWADHLPTMCRITVFLCHPSKAENYKSSHCLLMNNLQIYIFYLPVKGLWVSNPRALPRGLLSEQRPTTVLLRCLKVCQFCWLWYPLLILELSPEGLVAQANR